MPCKVLHGVSGGVQCVHFRRFDLKTRLHPLPQLPLPDLPLPDFPFSQFALPHGGVSVVQAGHVVGQQRVRRVEGHKEGVVSVCGRHDVGAGILAEGAQGGGVWTDVGRHSCDSGGWPIERWSHVSRSGHLRLPNPSLMRGTGSLRGSLSLLLSLSLPLSLLLSLPLSFLLFSCFLLSLALGLLQCLFSLFGQFRHRQRSEVEVCPGT